VSLQTAAPHARTLICWTDRRTHIAGAVASVAAAACLVRFGTSAHGLIAAFAAVVLVILAAIDLERRILPNVIVLPAAAVVYAAQLAFFPQHALDWTLAAVGCALFFLVALLISPAGLGMGDVKLGLLLGALLGKSVVAALFFGLVGAGVFGVVMLASHGSSARQTAIPLGPFLAVGALLALFLS